MNYQQERIDTYMHLFNIEKDYIQCHHISRELLQKGENERLARSLATLSAVMEQAVKKKCTGYKKLHKKFLEQLEEINDFPFEEEDLRLQLQLLDEEMTTHPEESISPIQLRKKE
ncbi:hypothetical protein [Pseudalkalibacillus berkeleyi]|uniref:Uncharacterized protein n=1 Tax=Pseudalkalibacillus berkeleyi TaxID=1069813 RepID=A0ABS9H3G3_9BACL|nr:hypothetical protein [Pseudalkalibacillus berkeleyi]MCF6138449.1 hypothetical protein [Pseudalkalibacillus berkeleyi]